MILIVDNYDSFVHNLARYFRLFQLETRVVRNDQLDWVAFRQSPPAAVVISPGPYGPGRAGISLQVVREFAGQIPILGVCLGHQVIVEAMGGAVHSAREIVHGRASWMKHDEAGEFTGLPSPMQVGRYHSLMADHRLPASLVCSATASDGTILAVRHRDWPVFGWQFHPESVLTPDGCELIRNWLRTIGWVTPPSPPMLGQSSSMARRAECPLSQMAQPISF